MLLSVIPNLSDGVFFALMAVVAVLAIAGIIFSVIKIRQKKNKSAERVEPAAQQIAEPEPEETVLAEEEPAEEPEEIEEPVEEVIEEEPAEEPEEIEEPVAEVIEEEPAEEPEEIEEPVEEVIEEEPAEEPEEIEEPVESEPEESEPEEPEDEEEEVQTAAKLVGDEEGYQRLIIIKYNKSFTAKLIQSPDTAKEYYSAIKNELLSYKGVKSRISWKCETFHAGRTTLAKMSVRGKSLSLFLALDPKKYAESKYIIDDMSEVAAHEKTPLLYRIKNDRRLKYSKELIAEVMDGRVKLEQTETVDYAKQYPYEKIEPLLKRGLVKELTDQEAQSGNTFKLKESVKATEVNELIQDEIAVALIENSEEISDRTKVEIINIDILSRYFNDGETVTLAEIQKRVPKFPKNATAIKVLARGTLDKKLKVIADNFSIEAAKMIILTGGSLEKKKSK